MILRNIIMAAAGAEGGVNVEEVFATATYLGVAGDQTITNGIDLAGEGGVVWTKSRSATRNHYIFDTTAPLFAPLVSNSAGARQPGLSSGSSFNSDGFSVGFYSQMNNTGESYVSWTFRKAPAFFDLVSYTGNGAISRSVAHALGQSPGMVILKRTDDTGNWIVYHRSLSGTGNALRLHTNSQQIGYESGTFSLSSSAVSFDFDIAAEANINGASYVMYTFAHNTSGAIQCDYFVTNESGVGTFSHEWSEGAQFLMLKAFDGSTGDWEVYDTVRDPAGWGVSDDRIRLNITDGEDSVSRLSESSGTLTFTGLAAFTAYILLLVKAPPA